MASHRVPLIRFWQPRHWPTWVAVLLLRIIVSLPQPLRMACGRGLGRVAMTLLRERRRVARINLNLCFPEMDAATLDSLTRRHFESLGMGVIELGMAWWCSPAEVQRLVQVEGIEHMQAALAGGRGVLIVSGHFASTEFAGRAVVSLLPPMAAMYRPSARPLNDQIMRRCRGNTAPELIDKKSVRQLLKTLKANRPVWYAADQAYNRRGTVLVPFFGEPATTNTAISQLARVSRAAVVPFVPERLPHGQGYTARFLPPLRDFPSGDDAADAVTVNAMLENQIRRIPEQYYWVHRRFKDREGLPDPYARQTSR